MLLASIRSGTLSAVRRIAKRKPIGHNSAVKGFEQEHIDDAAKVLQAPRTNAKLSQVKFGILRR